MAVFCIVFWIVLSGLANAIAMSRGVPMSRAAGAIAC
jgi:hypothetical protein